MNPSIQEDERRMTRHSMSADDKWRAVIDRDAACDGLFVYGVVTTGVYCRPSCPARQPLPENVRYFDSCEQAHRAGFRPCKRCRPNETATGDRHAALVARACRIIETAEQTPTLETLAAAVGLSPHYFHRLFSKITGLTPRAYARAGRGERLRAGVGASRTITEAIYEAGYTSSSRFYENAGDVLGMSPSARRAGGTGETIRFAVGECSLGCILVAATDRGVCSISLGDDPDELLGAFQDEFRNAELVGGDRDFERLVARVVGFVEAPATGLDLPLDIRGTAFQQRVWDALRRIPPGKTATYAEIADAIGSPKSVRAVAGACAANRLAVAIPCHRVIRSDGGLSGYRWGIDRKRALLEREAAGDCPGRR